MPYIGNITQDFNVSNAMLDTDSVTSIKIVDGTIEGADIAANLDLSDTQKIRFGAGNDLQIYHDGTESVIHDAGTGLLRLRTDSFRLRNAANTEHIIKAVEDGAVELYFNTVKKFETTNTGISVAGSVAADGLAVGDSELATFGSSADLQIFHGGTDSHITNNTGQLKIAGDAVRITNNAVSETQALFTANGAVELYYDNSKKFETESFGATLTGNLDVTSGDVKLLTDNKSIQFGASADLTLLHSGSTGVLNCITGDLHIKTTSSGDDIILISNDDIELQPQAGEAGIKVIGNGAVELYYDNSKKFETTSAGNQIFGNLVCGTVTLSGGGVQIQDDDKFIAGNGDDLQLYHDGGNSYILNSTGNLILKDLTDAIYLQAPQIIFQDETTGENIAKFISDGAVELYHDNSKKLETTSTGLKSESSSNLNIHLLKTGAQDTLIQNTGQTEICAATGGASGQRIVFRIGANTGSMPEIARFTPDGLCFGSDTAAANALDDYEEGTWTPTNTIGLTLTNNNEAYYIKIGKLVMIQFDISFSGASDTSHNAELYNHYHLQLKTQQVIIHKGLYHT